MWVSAILALWYYTCSVSIHYYIIRARGLLRVGLSLFQAGGVLCDMGARMGRRGNIQKCPSLRKRCTLIPIHAERIDYIHVPAWVTTSFPQHLPNKSKLRKAWFSSILSDFSLQITCCLEYFVYFCIEIHLFRRDVR